LDAYVHWVLKIGCYSSDILFVRCSPTNLALCTFHEEGENIDGIFRKCKVEVCLMFGKREFSSVSINRGSTFTACDSYLVDNKHIIHLSILHYILK